MALLSKLEKKSPDRHSVHKPINGTYMAFSDSNKRYVQIDTYGSTTRQVPGKISQSIQLDEASAKQIWLILGKEFSF